MLEAFVSGICSTIRESIEAENTVANFFELRELEMCVDFQFNSVPSAERPENEKVERDHGKSFLFPKKCN